MIVLRAVGVLLVGCWIALGPGAARAVPRSWTADTTSAQNTEARERPVTKKHPRTNVALFDSVAGEVAKEILGTGSIPPGRPIEIVPPVPGDTLSLFEQRVLERLRADGLSVRVAAPGSELGDPAGSSPKASDGALRLGLRVESKSVLYTSRVGRFPVGTKGYERLVTVAAQARLVDAATGEVLWARSGAKSAADFVKAGDVAAAASGNGLFAPTPPRGSSLGFLEPLFVSGVVVALVVLFYSNRS